MADHEKQIPFNPEIHPDQYEYVPYDQDPIILGLIKDENVSDVGRNLRLRMQAWDMQRQILNRQPDNELYVYMTDLAESEVASFLQRYKIDRSIRLKEPPAEQ